MKEKERERILEGGYVQNERKREKEKEKKRETYKESEREGKIDIKSD